jgi:GntR family transcriptional regulator, transcriptional repressor for pyruvate dehydrogenase complex
MEAENLSERAATRVARNIVSDIQERALRPGAKLDPEHLMIQKFGVARATVREALRFLELQGALRIKAGPGGGPVVSVPDTDHLASAISLQLQFANATFEAVLDARRSIYPVLVAEAAENASHQDIAALRRCVERLSAATEDSDETAREARHFYELVAVASNNLVLGFLVNALHRMSQHSGIVYDVEQRQASARNADKILQAIEAGDAEKARAVSKTMHAAAKRYWEKNAPDLLNTPVSWMAI